MVRMVRQPAHVLDSQASVDFVPGLPAIHRAKDTLPRARYNHTFAGNHTGHMLALEGVAGNEPFTPSVFGDPQTVVGRRRLEV